MSGVRSSCESVARNWSLARLAASAWSRACSVSASRPSRSASARLLLGDVADEGVEGDELAFAQRR